jgi:hypothetical protein
MTGREAAMKSNAQNLAEFSIAQSRTSKKHRLSTIIQRLYAHFDVYAHPWNNPFFFRVEYL